MAALFENGRVRFNRDLLVERQKRTPGDRWLIARVEINYLAEGHFPDPIEVASAIGVIGSRSWTIYSAAWQSGRCVALCDSTIVYQAKDGKRAISDDFRAELESWRFRG